jgi:Domain of unknown function (DUF4145)
VAVTKTYTNSVGEELPRPSEEIPNTMASPGTEQQTKIIAAWMECPNNDCRRVIITVYTSFHDPDDDGSDPDDEDKVWEKSWIAFPPRAGDRPIDPLVPKELASDYREAAAILSDSPKASAAIARRILADILERYGGYADFQLSKRIEAFAKDTKHPPSLRENAKYLTQIGDFAAHTQKDTVTNEIVDVEQGEAEWTLDVIDGLFEHFIVAPERDKARRTAFDAKIKRAGRKPIK